MITTIVQGMVLVAFMDIGPKMISKRQDRKLRKEGEILEDKEYTFHFVQIHENILYLLFPTQENCWTDEVYKRARRRLLCKYGKNTKWCTALPDGDHNNDYLDRDIYIVHMISNYKVGDTLTVNLLPIYQFAAAADTSEEFKNFSNDPIFYPEDLEKDVLDFLTKDCNLNLHEFYEDEPDEDEDEDTYYYYDDENEDDEDDEEDIKKDVKELIDGIKEISNEVKEMANEVKETLGEIKEMLKEIINKK